MGTLFASVYNRFLNKITDDMYMELTAQDTIKDLQNLIVDAIPGFEFPRKSLDYTILVKPLPADGVPLGYDVGGLDDVSYFQEMLSSEEINILAILMMKAWLQRQITTIENIRMKYSGTDFKMTSQANHLSKLMSLFSEIERQSIHLQRLYKRRRYIDNGQVESNWSIFREDTAISTNNIKFNNTNREEYTPSWEDV